MREADANKVEAAGMASFRSESQETGTLEGDESLSSPLQGKVILVVEDHEPSRELVAHILARAGAEVREADSVDGALDFLRRQACDAIVSDLGLPGKSGFELIKGIESLGGRDCSIPVLALTAYASRDDRRNALAAGFARHLPKPVLPRDLVGALAGLLQGGSPQSLPLPTS